MISNTSGLNEMLFYSLPIKKQKELNKILLNEIKNTIPLYRKSFIDIYKKFVGINKFDDCSVTTLIKLNKEIKNYDRITN